MILSESPKASSLEKNKVVFALHGSFKHLQRVFNLFGHFAANGGCQRLLLANFGQQNFQRLLQRFFYCVAPCRVPPQPQP